MECFSVCWSTTMELNKMTHIIETVTFKLNADASEEAFLKGSPALNTFLKTRKGHVMRHLSKNEDNVWLEYIQWETLEDAKAAAAVVMSEETLAPYMSSIDESSAKMSHSLLLVQDS